MGTILPGLAIGATLAIGIAIGIALGAGLVLVLAMPRVRRRVDDAATRLEAALDRLDAGVLALDERAAASQRGRTEAPEEAAGAESPRPEPSRRRRADPTDVRRLAQRGRHSVEIAQLLDADVGEIELLLRLDAARAESVSGERPAPGGRRS